MSVCPGVPVVVMAVVSHEQPDYIMSVVPWCSGRCNGSVSHDDDDELMLNVLRCQLTY